MLKGEADLEDSHEQFMYRLTLDKGVKSSFPNVEIMLRMYLVLMVTNCTDFHLIFEDENNQEQASNQHDT